MDNFKDVDSKIVIFGMSCVGKTTFAQMLKTHTYLCFDQMFHWHLIETLGLSIQENLRHIKNQCDNIQNSYVLDGWHLGDNRGLFLPTDATVYVLWAPYKKIISQYRIHVSDPEEFRHMYNKWYYETDYKQFSKVRYFENNIAFQEITQSEFLLRQNVV
jgi:hypothetical protein